jgi:hypothetical protein
LLGGAPAPSAGRALEPGSERGQAAGRDATLGRGESTDLEEGDERSADDELDSGDVPGSGDEPDAGDSGTDEAPSDAHGDAEPPVERQRPLFE